MKNGYINSFLGEKEKILLAARQHWFLLFGSIIFEFVVILILISAVSVLSISMDNPLFGFGYLLIIVPLASMVKDILVYYNRQFIVTNRRVIEISGVFSKNVTDSSLEKVNDVKMMQSIAGRVFNFGSIQILTASELGANEFRFIGDPIKFKTAMLNAKERMPLDEAGIFHAMAEKSIPGLIDELDQLRRKGIVTEEEFAAKKKELLAKM
jgi:uncharacterized membrane protein YdbT with pleckstrin-like domain